MRILTVLVALFLAHLSVVAQRTTDSLRNELQKHQAAEERTPILIRLCDAFFLGSKYDSLNKYASELLTHTSKDSDEYLAALSYEAQSYMRKDSTEFFRRARNAMIECARSKFAKGAGINALGIGSRYLTLGNYRQSMVWLNTGDSALAKSNGAFETMLRADILRTISAVHHHMGKYTDALDTGLESLKLSEQSNDGIQLLKSYLNLGGLYGELSSPDNGLGTADDRRRYYVEAKKYMKLSYLFSIPNASPLTQGATATNLGMLYREDGQNDSANYYLDIAIAIGKKTNFHEMLGNAYLTKAQIWESRPDSATYYSELAVVSARLSLNPYLEISTALQKARSLYQNKNYKDAETLARKALEQAKSIQRQNDVRAAWLLLHDIQLARNDYKAALDSYKNYESTKDSIVSEKNYATIEELKVRYETELKDGEIRSLQQESSLQAMALTQRNYLVYGLIAAILLGSVVIYLFYQRRSLVQNQRVLSVENKLLRSQLNPHFIFNALVSIQRFLNDNDPRTASDYLAKFSKLMRQTLEHSRVELVRIEDELQSVRNYLDLQKLRTKDAFTYSITIDPLIDPSETKIPPMFIQPFVENSIEHGFRTMTSGGIIDISLKQKDGGLEITIRDNGSGITTPGSSEHRSLSTTITRERMELLNETGGQNISLQYSTPSTGHGTIVVVYLRSQ